MAFVYWITDDVNENIWAHGYIGITSKTVNKRLNGHKWSYLKHISGHKQSSSKLYNKVKSLGGWDSIRVLILCEATLDYCLNLEKKLRNSPNIGWNITIGGEKGGMSGRVHSPTTKLKMSEAHKTRSPVTQETRQKLSSAGLGRKSMFIGANNFNYKRPAWKAPAATSVSLKSWSLCNEIYQIILKKPSATYISILALFEGVSKQSFQVLVNKIKTGWIPAEDQEWLIFKREYDAARKQ